MILKCALWKPVNQWVGKAHRAHLNKAVVLHTAATDIDETKGLYSKTYSGSTGAHFYIRGDGIIEQYADSDAYLGHAWDANTFAAGVETWDGAQVIQWNPAQLDAIDTLLREMSIPAQALKETPSDGVGYHREYNSWNTSNHSCPGDPRVAQVPGVIARLGGDMAVTWDEIETAMGNALGWKKENVKAFLQQAAAVRDRALESPLPANADRASGYNYLKGLEQTSGPGHSHAPSVEVAGAPV
jgi:hypothetical protein